MRPCVWTYAEFHFTDTSILLPAVGTAALSASRPLTSSCVGLRHVAVALSLLSLFVPLSAALSLSLLVVSLFSFSPPSCWPDAVGSAADVTHINLDVQSVAVSLHLLTFNSEMKTQTIFLATLGVTQTPAFVIFKISSFFWLVFALFILALGSRTGPWFLGSGPVHRVCEQETCFHPNVQWIVIRCHQIKNLNL